METTPLTAESILQSIATQPTATPVAPVTQDTTKVDPPTQVQTDSKVVTDTDPVTPATKVDTPQSKENSVTEPITDWDLTTPAVSTDAPAKTDSFDFSSIGKAVEMDIKSQDQLIQEFKNLKTENETLKKSSTTAADLFANDVLKQANEIAKNNGDYLGFLGVASINYDAIDSRSLVEGDVRGYFPEGPEGDEKMNSYLDSLDETELNIRGSQIRQALKSEQAMSKQSLVQATEAKRLADIEKKTTMDKQLSSSLEKVKDIDGFSLNPTHKKQLFNDLSTGEVFKKHFYTDGKYDFDKAIKAAFILNEYTKVTTYLRDKSKTEGKRDVINNLTNAELNKPASTVSSDTTKDPLDMWMARIQGK